MATEGSLLSTKSTVTDRISKALSSRENFNDLVYTDVAEAVAQLEERWSDKDLGASVAKYLNDDIPEPLKKGFGAVLFRQLATPNYELRRFMVVPDVMNLKPVFWEYHDDKFTSNNPLKHSLGKMIFHEGIGKKGGNKLHYHNVIDFNKSNGKMIKEVKTLWGQGLVDFHHELLHRAYPQHSKHIFDASLWFSNNGKTAKDYYRRYIALAIRNGILFENFVFQGSELDFTREIFLPAFFDVWDEFGVKPLIVALEPTEIEGDLFWMCHPFETKAHVEKKQIEL